MANDMPDPASLPTPITSPPEVNGQHVEPRPEGDPVRERFRLHAQCAKLRHWCRGLLDAEGTEGVLTPDVEYELRQTPPAMSMDDVFTALRAISQREPLPANAIALTGDVIALAAERERLRKLFFALHDAALPDDPLPTEEELLAERNTLSDKSISEMLDELEREMEAGA